MLGLGELFILLVFTLAVPVVVLVVVISRLRRRVAAQVEAVRRELDASGENVERGPESASYRGATTRFSKVKGDGVIALTESRLVFRKIAGEPIEIARDEIESVREDKWFNGAYRSGRQHLILKLTDGSEVGFMVRDHPAWMAAVG